MDVMAAPLPGVLILKPARFRDARGVFIETYNKQRLAKLGIAVEFVQDNISFSASAGTLRGLHFQRPPFAQAKLVSILKGSVIDVVVDLRKDSLTFAQHVSVRLSSEQGNQLFVPEGFAHGFLTLEPDTLFAYKVSAYYSPEHESGIKWNDARLGIDWGLGEVVLSDKDARLPAFDPSLSYFE